MEDFEKLCEEPHHWRVTLRPHPPGDEEENHVEIIIEAKIPAPYPNEKPDFDVIVQKGLKEAQRQELLDLLNEKADENIGMPMLYTVAEELREWLLEHNEPMQDDSMFAAMMRREMERKAEKEQQSSESTPTQQQLSEEEEMEARNRQKILEGTPVTPETFLEWRARFEAETAQPEEQAAVNDKLSGKQYFIQHTLSTDWEEDNADEGVAVDEALFAGEDEDDLDDLDDMDDSDEDDE